MSLFLLALLAAQPPDERPPLSVVALDRKEPVSFATEVAPILAAKCAACHSGTVLRGRLNLGSYEGMLKGGTSGPALVPGKSADSLLIQQAGRTQQPFMPPIGEEPLTPEELALLKLWIDEGAVAGVLDPGHKARPRPEVRLGPLPARIQPVRALALSPDKSVLAASRGNQIHLYDPATGSLLRTLTTPDAQPPAAHATVVEALAFAPDGKTLASGSFREVILWDAATGEVRHRLTDFTDRVVALAFSPDGQLLATGGGAPTVDGVVKLIAVAKGQAVRELPSAHSDTVFGVSFSPDGARLATGGADKLVKVWEVSADGRGEVTSPLRTFEGHTHHVLDVAWRSDGRTLASAGADDIIKIWDFERGEQTRTIRGHGKQVSRLAFVGRTANVLTCSGDGTARLWNVDTGAAGRTFPSAGDFLYAVAVSADGQMIVAGGEEGVVRIYGADGRLLRTLSK